MHQGEWMIDGVGAEGHECELSVRHVKLLAKDEKGWICTNSFSTPPTKITWPVISRIDGFLQLAPAVKGSVTIFVNTVGNTWNRPGVEKFKITLSLVLWWFLLITKIPWAEFWTTSPPTDTSCKIDANHGKRMTGADTLPISICLPTLIPICLPSAHRLD